MKKFPREAVWPAPRFQALLSSAKCFPEVPIPICRLPIQTFLLSIRACSAWEPVAVSSTDLARNKARKPSRFLASKFSRRKWSESPRNSKTSERSQKLLLLFSLLPCFSNRILSARQNPLVSKKNFMKARKSFPTSSLRVFRSLSLVADSLQFPKYAQGCRISTAFFFEDPKAHFKFAFFSSRSSRFLLTSGSPGSLQASPGTFSHFDPQGCCKLFFLQLNLCNCY